MDLAEVLLSKCIEKYEEAISEVSDDEVYGTVTKLLVIEHMEAIRKTKYFCSKKYIRSWNYRLGTEIEERHNRDKEKTTRMECIFQEPKPYFMIIKKAGKLFCPLMSC